MIQFFSLTTVKKMVGAVFFGAALWNQILKLNYSNALRSFDVDEIAITKNKKINYINQQ